MPPTREVSIAREAKAIMHTQLLTNVHNALDSSGTLPQVEHNRMKPYSWFANYCYATLLLLSRLRNEIARRYFDEVFGKTLTHELERRFKLDICKQNAHLHGTRFCHLEML